MEGGRKGGMERKGQRGGRRGGRGIPIQTLHQAVVCKILPSRCCTIKHILPALLLYRQKDESA